MSILTLDQQINFVLDTTKEMVCPLIIFRRKHYLIFILFHMSMYPCMENLSSIRDRKIPGQYQ